MAGYGNPIKSLIQSSGPIPFAKFMELALYHPEYGYYSSDSLKIGKEGDYYTSPHVHPAFGEVISKVVSRVYEFIQEKPFTIVEMGAGKGLLALDVLNSIKRDNTDLYKNLHYLVIEINPNLRSEEERLLKNHLDRVNWVNSLSEIEPESIRGVFLSNELVDSFPVHRAKFKDGKLFEIYVALDEREGFYEILDNPSTEDLINYFKEYNLEFEEGQELEINLRAGEWLQEVVRVLAKGVVITIDYGYLAEELFSPVRPRGTLLCYYKHTTSENPYIRIGEQDITAHVDFSNLIRCGERLGLNTIKYTTQGQFLIDCGILEILKSYSGEEKPSNLSVIKSRMAIKNLFLPQLMGDTFKVLMQEKILGVKSEDFYPKSKLKISFP